MALPGDVTTFDLHFGDDVEGYTDVTGAVTLLGAKGIVYPIDLATGKRLNLVHVATGQAILPVDVEFTLDDAGKAKAVVADLPHTDNASLSVVGFGYQADWKLASGRSRVTPGKKRFAVPTAAGASVDYDLLDVADAVPGVLVPVTYGRSAYDLAVDEGFVGDEAAWLESLVGPAGSVSDASVAALVPGAGLTATALKAAFATYVTLAANPDTIIAGTITRDANGAATSAPVVWPDGSPGTYTATTVSTAFPGAVDAYTITYGSPVTKTYTQSTVTRDANGAVTARPALVVS